MTLTTKIGRMLGKKTKVSPKMLAYGIVSLAVQHAESLEKAGVVPQEVDGEAIFCELLRAYFCFTSLWVGDHIRGDTSLNLYGALMLKELRGYPDEVGVLVRGAFADGVAIDDAVACYVRGAPSGIDRAAIQKIAACSVFLKTILYTFLPVRFTFEPCGLLTRQKNQGVSTRLDDNGSGRDCHCKIFLLRDCPSICRIVCRDMGREGRGGLRLLPKKLDSTMNEKEAIERATAEAFLEHYNDIHGSSFQVTEHGDAPDIIARDELGNRLQLEIVMTEDRGGDIKSTLGRSDVRSIESLKRYVELVRQGKAEAMQRASSLVGNVTESLKERLQAKMAKRYGPNTALVIRDTSGVDWDWDLVIGDPQNNFGDQPNPFDRGIWLLNRSKDRLFQLL